MIETFWTRKKRGSKRFGYCCALLSVASPVAAATVVVTANPVLVSQGKGYHAVFGSKTLGPGDSVMVQPGGHAEIVYDDGCRVHVEAGSVASVAGSQGGNSPCALSTPDNPEAVAGPSNSIIAAGALAAEAALAVGTFAETGPASP